MGREDRESQRKTQTHRVAGRRGSDACRRCWEALFPTSFGQPSSDPWSSLGLPALSLDTVLGSKTHPHPQLTIQLLALNQLQLRGSSSSMSTWLHLSAATQAKPLSLSGAHSFVHSFLCQAQCWAVGLQQGIGQRGSLPPWCLPPVREPWDLE